MKIVTENADVGITFDDGDRIGIISGTGMVLMMLYL